MYSFSHTYRYTSSILFFFNDTATTEIYTLSLHDALPISKHGRSSPGSPAPESVFGIHERARMAAGPARQGPLPGGASELDRKSTRLNSSHGYISYAVFCLKKKKKTY